jgi:NTP pyrophosphatase (non-canonical NTP hydrolase)
MGQLTEWQERVWKNKLAKGFNTTNVEREFNYTYAELAEAYESFRKEKGDLDEELADVLIFVLSLARMNNLDLETAVLHKMSKNEDRQYVKKNGHHVQKENV